MDILTRGARFVRHGMSSVSFASFALLSALFLSTIALVAVSYAVAGGEGLLTSKRSLEVEPTAFADPMGGEGLADEKRAAMTEPRKPRVHDRVAQERNASDTIQLLMNESCDASPRRLSAGPDAYVVHVSATEVQEACLDDVALQFDRLHAGASPIVFELEHSTEKPDRPVLHVSSIETSGLSYIRLRDGTTLYVGAVVDGWALITIDDRGAAFAKGDDVFRLAINFDGEREP